MRPDDLHEAGIDATRKTRMTFDQGTLLLHWCVIHIINDLYRMRIAHGNGRYPARVVVDIQRPQRFLALVAAGEPMIVKRYFGRCEYRRTHINRNAVVIL